MSWWSLSCCETKWGGVLGILYSQPMSTPNISLQWMQPCLFKQWRESQNNQKSHEETTRVGAGHSSSRSAQCYDRSSTPTPSLNNKRDIWSSSSRWCWWWVLEIRWGLMFVGAHCPYSLATAHRWSGQLPEQHRSDLRPERRLTRQSDQHGTTHTGCGSALSKQRKATRFRS